MRAKKLQFNLLNFNFSISPRALLLIDFHNDRSYFRYSTFITIGLSSQVQGQYQVIPAYYDQNGSIVMGGVRGLSSAATPMRLVSPAPVLVNRAPSQPPPGPPAPPPPNLYSQPTSTSHSNATPGECLGESNRKSGIHYTVVGRCTVLVVNISVRSLVKSYCL